MLTVRRAGDRGRSATSWLDSRHTFSFADYHDPRHMGFRTLRVVNEDRVRPGTGFGTHPHRDMEIVTWVLEGALEHEDSLGNGDVIRPGDAQRMSAGTGIHHSEWNHSKSEPVHFVQIWILPERAGLPPSYEQKTIGPYDGLRLVASRDGRAGSVAVHQDADVLALRLTPGGSASHALRTGRGAWVQALRGAVDIGGTLLRAGDGAAVEGIARLDFSSPEGGEALLFDLA